MAIATGTIINYTDPNTKAVYDNAYQVPKETTVDHSQKIITITQEIYVSQDVYNQSLTDNTIKPIAITYIDEVDPSAELAVRNAVNPIIIKGGSVK